MINKTMRIHFVGIGGIGMSGIAHVLQRQGHIISGCDSNNNQKSIVQLQALGCSIFEGNDTNQCKNQDYDIIVYSSVVSQSPEIKRAQEKNIMTVHRSIMLAELMKSLYSIGITGSHGKTTTTSLLSHLLLENGDDPTFLIGGHLSDSGMNARYGKGRFLITEADESDRSLLNLFPSAAIITTISPEHLDTYNNVHDIMHTMQQFIDRLPFHGVAIIGIDNPFIKTLIPQKHHRLITFGCDEHADWRATNIILEPHSTTFDVHHKTELQTTITLPLAGHYNILNALAACAAAHHIGMPLQNIKQHLATFKGVDRRFSFHGTYKGAAIYDDYGHHPIEIKNALTVARQKTKGNLTVIFQPHRYTRTAYLWDDFVQTLAQAPTDHLIITDIYGAGEQILANITAQHLVESIKQSNPNKHVSYVPFDKHYTQLKQALEKFNHCQQDTLLFQGAGLLNLLAQDIKNS